MKCLLMACVSVMLVLVGCGSGGPTRHNDFIPLTSIEITAASTTIAAKTSTRLTVTGNFSGLFKRDITDQAVWTSNAATVANFITASQPNRVSGLQNGIATLTATVSGVSNTLNLTVTNATISSLALSPLTPSLAKGLSKQFSVIGTFSDSTVQDLTSDATWSSSDATVASVSDVVASRGFSQAQAVGTATITATFDTLPVSTVMTVTAAALQSITVTPANPSILSLSSQKFTATGQFTDSTSSDISGQVTWSSSLVNLATVAAGGTASTLAQGTTAISASLNGISGSTNLKITGGNLTSIALSAEKITPVNGVITVVKDTSAVISAVGTFSTGATRDISGVVSWTSAAPTLASVTSVGGNRILLNALGATPSNLITAQFGTVSGSGTMAVTAPTLQSVTISPVSLTMSSGTSARFTLRANYSDGSSQDVTANTTWQTSDQAIATVGDLGIAKGRVSAVAAGSPVITGVFGGLQITAPVTVTARTLSGVTVQPAVATLASGNQTRFTLTANYSDGFSQDVSEDANWTIDKSNVAILADSTNQPGQVVGVDSGSAILSAIFGNKSQTVTVSVP